MACSQFNWSIFFVWLDANENKKYSKRNHFKRELNASDFHEVMADCLEVKCERGGRSIQITVLMLEAQTPLLIMNFANDNSHSEDSHSEASQYTDKHAKRGQFRRKNRQHWSSQENIKYCRFLYQNKGVFESERLRKRSRVFTQLSAFLSSRSTSCVKSHHQKMIKRHEDVDSIIRFMENKYKVVIVPLEDTDASRNTKQAYLQTDRETSTQVFQGNPTQKQHCDNLQIFEKDLLLVGEIEYDGFELSEWTW